MFIFVMTSWSVMRWRDALKSLGKLPATFPKVSKLCIQRFPGGALSANETSWRMNTGKFFYSPSVARNPVICAVLR